MKVIHKISGSIFLFTSALPLLLAVCLTLKRSEIRQHMRGELGIQKLQTIKLAEEDVIWMDDHEIWVNESMFDIHSKKTENGFITFTGLYDEEETLLVKREQNQEERDQDKNKVIISLLNCIQHVYYNRSVDITFETHPQSREFPFWSSGDLQQHYDIVTPPPRWHSVI